MVNDRYLSFWWSIPTVRQVICWKGALQNGIFSVQQTYHTFNVDAHISYPSCSLYIHRSSCDFLLVNAGIVNFACLSTTLSESVKPLSAMTISPKILKRHSSLSGTSSPSLRHKGNASLGRYSDQNLDSFMVLI